ncbi:hypothetical protein GVN24_34480 [Rhizobium sp. CRIBSB]|nr:hypothetical protein [Rhizobium sp. CRIBSB]
MSNPRSLPLVLDTSVWINLLATGRTDEILAALKVPVLVPMQVFGEVRRDPVSGRLYTPDSHPLTSLPMVELIAMTPAEIETFLDLVAAGSADRLGDGEAASIALAAHRRSCLGIDERKARRILRERFGHISLCRSTDLLTDKLVIAALGVAVAEQCYELALSVGRMHVEVGRTI